MFFCSFQLDQLENQVEPVSWNYFPRFERQYIASSAWRTYSNRFKQRWAASAFKGGIHRYSMFTNTTHHVLNNRQWLYFMESGGLPANFFNGIILTGWSRFDHFMPLCDLFPTAYPSLLYSLHVLNTNQYFPSAPVEDCPSVMRTISKDPQLCSTIPGISIWTSIVRLSKFFERVQGRLKFFTTVIPEYNREHHFIRRHDLNQHISELNGLKSEFSSRKKSIQSQFSFLYTEDVIKEWIDLYLRPLEQQVEHVLSQFSALAEEKIWPRRPLL